MKQMNPLNTIYPNSFTRRSQSGPDKMQNQINLFRVGVP